MTHASTISTFNVRIHVVVNPWTKLNHLNQMDTILINSSLLVAFISWMVVGERLMMAQRSQKIKYKSIFTYSGDMMGQEENLNWYNNLTMICTFWWEYI